MLYFVKPTDDRGGPRARTLRVPRGARVADEFTADADPFAAGQPGHGARLGSARPSRRSSSPQRPPTCRGARRRHVRPAGSASDPSATGRTSWSTPPSLSEQEARELAISLLRERAYEFITGSGEVIGLPDLRPGDNLELDGLGRRFSGTYYVKKVEHTIGGSGFTSRFEVRRRVRRRHASTGDPA